MTTQTPLHLLNGAFAARARPFVDLGILDSADVLTIDAVAPRFSETNIEVLLGLAFAIRGPRAGHVGVHIPTLQEQLDDEHTGRHWNQEAEVGSEIWPEDGAAWEQAVLASSLVGSASSAQSPFVRQELADGRVLVMSRRMWREQERLVAATLARAAGQPTLKLAESDVTRGLELLFDTDSQQGIEAVRAATQRQLTIITGGPGTGKTYSIKRLLALLILASEGGSPLRIELAAPTGKAAVRMAQAIAEDLDELPTSDGVRAVLLGLHPKTLHKLLGIRPDGSSRQTMDRPIPADLIVVDEASMIDLTMMRRLMESVLPGARLILLGDRDQLASVEAGTVLADFVGPVLDGLADSSADLAKSVVPFNINYRFKDAPTLAAIAQGLRGIVTSADPEKQLNDVVNWMTGAAQVQNETLPNRVTHLGAPAFGRPTSSQLDRLAAPYLSDDGFIGILAAALAAYGKGSVFLQSKQLHLRLLDALKNYQILAVHRLGPLGVSGIEQEVTTRAKEAIRCAIREHSGLPIGASVALPAQADHWLGRPVLVTQNAYDLGLMNGDIGLVLPTNHGLSVVFPSKEGGEDTTKEVALARLPNHMGAFALTVHKSQGSQFKKVGLVLAGRDSPLQTRELVYTGITRASSRLQWLGDPVELKHALERRVARNSGLRDLIWK